MRTSEQKIEKLVHEFLNRIEHEVKEIRIGLSGTDRDIEYDRAVDVYVRIQELRENLRKVEED